MKTPQEKNVSTEWAPGRIVTYTKINKQKLSIWYLLIYQISSPICCLTFHWRKTIFNINSLLSVRPDILAVLLQHFYSGLAYLVALQTLNQSLHLGSPHMNVYFGFWPLSRLLAKGLIMTRNPSSLPVAKPLVALLLSSFCSLPLFSAYLQWFWNVLLQNTLVWW